MNAAGPAGERVYACEISTQCRRAEARRQDLEEPEKIFTANTYFCVRGRCCADYVVDVNGLAQSPHSRSATRSRC
jgi:hypothetical protein